MVTDDRTWGLAVDTKQQKKDLTKKNSYWVDINGNVCTILQSLTRRGKAENIEELKGTDLLCNVKLTPYGGQHYTGASDTFQVDAFVHALGWGLKECEAQLEIIRAEVEAMRKRKLNETELEGYAKRMMSRVLFQLKGKVIADRLKQEAKLKQAAKDLVSTDWKVREADDKTIYWESTET